MSESRFVRCVRRDFCDLGLIEYAAWGERSQIACLRGGSGWFYGALTKPRECLNQCLIVVRHSGCNVRDDQGKVLILKPRNVAGSGS